MSTEDAWGRGETQQKTKPKPSIDIEFPTGRGSDGDNVVVNGFDFWWSESIQEWLPTVDTLQKISGPSEKSWPDEH